ncbi:Indole-3-acetaldehyde oxidase [Ananas comosus]|uniref:Indole-3-acetaldehyde oxidase n=1 Tax=Ananas comosus TaxID=4615 RepID=A0A199UVG6_ANACO|nr:Indole-3-acetaldehyde oxidase [Ananas comosus]
MGEEEEEEEIPGAGDSGSVREEEEEEEMGRRVERLVFAINGERYEVSGVDPSTTLLEFIRTRTRYRGPKLGCGEGDEGFRVAVELVLFFYQNTIPPQTKSKNFLRVRALHSFAV